MSTLRAIRRITVAALIAALAAGALATSAAARGSAEYDGMRFATCRGSTATDLSLFVHRMTCRTALRTLAKAVDGDRRCLRGWRARSAVRLLEPEHRTGKARLTLCTRGHGSHTHAYAFHLTAG